MISLPIGPFINTSKTILHEINKQFKIFFEDLKIPEKKDFFYLFKSKEYFIKFREKSVAYKKNRESLEKDMVFLVFSENFHNFQLESI